MKSTAFLKASSLALMASFGVFVGAASAQTNAPAKPAAADTEGDQVVIITAQKFSTNIQKTPLSVAAVSGDSAMKRGDTQLDQVLAKVGSVRLLEGEDGPTFYIRGIGTGVPSNVGDPEVNLNIDGIYQSLPEYSRGGLYDVNRVEVARGPQGTLYGRNAVAGVVNIVTNDPNFNYESGISVGFGNYNSQQVQGYANFPLSDTLAVRAAYGSEQHSGYLSNGADDMDAQSGRVKLLWKPDDKLKLVVTADTTHEGGEGEGEIQLSPPPSGFPINTYALGDTFTSSKPWTGVDPGNAVRHTDFWSVHAQLDYNLGFGVLTAIPAYRNYSYQCLNCWRSETDQDQFAGEKQTSFELRLASEPNAPVTWLAGLYSLDGVSNNKGENLGPGADSFSDSSGNEVSVQGQQRFVSKTSAAFAQITVPLTEIFRLTAGVRYNQDQKSEIGYVYSETAGVIDSCSTAAAAPYTSVAECTFYTAKTWNATTYNLGAELDVAPASMLYAKISTGYKAGGFYQGAAPDSYQPEEITAYEIGSKNKFFDNNLQLNGSAFYYNYKNYQVNYINVINPVAAGIFGVETSNAQGAVLYGAELEARYRASPNDDIDVGLYPLHAKFRQLNTGGIFGGTYSGLPLPFAPSFSANLGYQHRWNTASGGDWIGRIETHYETSTWVTFQETAGTRQPAYWMSNAYLSYDFRNGKWTATLYVKNIEDTPVLVNAQSGPAGLEAGDIAPPRTYGVQMTAKF